MTGWWYFRRMKRYLFLASGLMILLASSSCRTGFEGLETPNSAPESHTIVDTIIRPGDDRLESEVLIHWWGDDPDGFIIGYEFTFDDIQSPFINWQFTEKQDSLFILAPPPGADTLDFIFCVRSIDNLNQADPTPACLSYPVKNSPPSVQYLPGLNNPIVSFPALKFFWEGNDPDGIANLSGYEIVWNDTSAAAFILGSEVSNVLIEAIDPTATELSCRLYPNSSETALAETLDGLVANSWNKLFIRAIDQSDSRSAWVGTDSIWVKQVQSNMLLVNAYTTISNPLSFYTEQLNTIGFTNFDTLQIFEETDGVYTQQSADNLTQERVFNMFDLIIWFSNSAESSLSLAQKTTGDFFAGGGKLFMSIYVSTSFDPLSNFLEFTPVASLVSPEDTTLILDIGAQLNPSNPDYPVLEGTSIVGVVKPVNLQLGAEIVYEAELTAKDNATLTFSPWEGNSIVIASKSSAGSTNFVLSTLEMQKLNGLLNISDLFQKIFIDDFGF